MPPSKRKQRRKATSITESSAVDMPDSSPSRPSAKKRKTNGGRVSTRRRSPSVDTLSGPGMEDSGDESEAVSQSDLIDSVVSYLQVSKEPIAASTQHANEKDQPENLQKVSAYAKIAGRDWTYFVRDQSVNIGRPPDDGKDMRSLNPVASSPIMDMKEMLPVHIDLGPSKIVSRHHASIFYDADYPEGGGWHVRVNGRNGVRVNNTLVKRGGLQRIMSGAILEISGTQMMFVTPGDKAQIDPYFIERAKLMATGEEFGTLPHAHPEELTHADFTRDNFASGSYHALAPALPNSKRAATPPPQDGRGQRSTFDSKPPQQSPLYNRGMMMESTAEIDYSKDGAKDLKPPFSYATMIAQAIFSSDEEKLTLSNIYAFIADRFAFYRHSNSGWQNSIRHNLSLNKAFQKVPRRTDEPGKGMKWQIAPEYRQEYWKKQARKGTASSAPSSPASSKEINPNFRGPNGQNLGYDTTMVSQFSTRDLTDGQSGPNAPRSINFQPFNSSQAQAPSSSRAFTPQRRGRTDTSTTVPDPSLELDDSPVSHTHHHPQHLPTYSLPSFVPPPHRSPSNPTLSSSYLDTPFKSSSHPHHPSMITPAPLRQNPRLAPPSTLVAPSKFMPDSSPAGPVSFWKGLMLGGTGQTPAHGVPDLSPVKNEVGDENVRLGGAGGRPGIMSSSPPPMMDTGSPSKPGRRGSSLAGAALTSSFGASSSQAALPPRAAARGDASNVNGNGSGAPANLRGGGGGDPRPDEQKNSGSGVIKNKNSNNNDDADDDGDGIGGFDLARGFQPIGSFHAGQGAAAASASARASS